MPLARGEARALLLAGARGESAAISAGLRRAAGDTVLLLDPRAALTAADLRQALLLVDDGAEVVVARRPEARRGAIHGAAELLLGAPAIDPRPRGFVLLRGPAATALPLYGALHTMLPAVARHWGLAVAEVRLPPGPAAQAAPGAPRLADLLSAFFLLRFSRLPLRFFGPIGALLLLAGTAIDAVLVYQKLALGQGLSDRPLLLLGTLLMVLGVQALSLGLVAELIVFVHARRLRDYRVAEEWSGAAAAPAAPARPDFLAARRRGAGQE
jgi:hypothetical protein